MPDIDLLAPQLQGSPTFQRALAGLIDRSAPIRQSLTNLITAVAHNVSVGNAPGFGSGQVDTYTPRDNVDVGFPMRVNYLIPSLTQRVNTAKLSFKLMAYRTYSSISLTSTGGTSNNHTHTHNHGSHAHTEHVAFNGAGGVAIGIDNVGVGVVSSSAFAPVDLAIINGTTPATDTTGQSADHTHSVSGTTTLGIATGTTASGITIAFDGVDKTAALGGPWSVDVVELDVTQFLATNPTAAWHAITLSSLTQGQIETHLKISLYGNAGALQ